MTKLTKAQRVALAVYGRPYEPGLSFLPDSLTAAEVYTRTEPRTNFATMSRTLDCLEAKGLVVGGFGATDYRYKITPAGRAALSLEQGEKP